MNAKTLLENLDSQVRLDLRQGGHETAQEAIRAITKHLWLSDIILFIKQEAVACGYEGAVEVIDNAGNALSRLEEEKRRDSQKQKGRTQRMVEELASEVSLAELAEMLAVEAEKQGCVDGARVLELASSNLP